MPNARFFIPALAALIGLSLAVTHPAAAQTTLTANSFTTNTASSGDTTSSDLTALGTTDWLNYGNYGSSTVNQKGTPTSVVGLISVATPYGTTAFNYQNFSAVPHASWTNGSTKNGGKATGSNVHDTWQVGGVNQGFTFTVTLPAKSTDVVDVFLGGYSANAAFQVFAGSTSLLNTTFATGSNANKGGYFSSSFSNSSASPQTLTYKFYETSADGSFDNVKLGDVTLASTPAAAK